MSDTRDPADVAAEKIKDDIRAACDACGGHGVGGQNRDGSAYECEYCGRPMQAVNAESIRAAYAERTAECVKTTIRDADRDAALAELVEAAMSEIHAFRNWLDGLKKNPTTPDSPMLGLSCKILSQLADKTDAALSRLSAPAPQPCERCEGTGAIPARTSVDDPSCPECDGEGTLPPENMKTYPAPQPCKDDAERYAQDQQEDAEAHHRRQWAERVREEGGGA